MTTVHGPGGADASMAGPGGDAHAEPRLFVSMDVEMGWGFIDQQDWRERAVEAAGVHDLIDRLVAVFVTRGVPVTWAVVAAMMLDDADAGHDWAPRHPPASWRQWSDLRAAGTAVRRGLFAPSVVDTVLAAPGHELASHSFVHYALLDRPEGLSGFGVDTGIAQQVHRETRGVAARSYVFARNQVDDRAIDVLRRAGFATYRGLEAGWSRRPDPHLARRGTRVTAVGRRVGRSVTAYLPRRTPGATPRSTGHGGPVDLPATHQVRQAGRPLPGLDDVVARVTRRDIRAAASRGRDIHLWSHPHNFLADRAAALDRLAVTLEVALEAGLRPATMGSVTGDRA